MTVQEEQRWKELRVRRPGDVPGTTPLAWQIDKHGKHSDRLLNMELPEDFPYPVERGDKGDALAVLALRESIRRDIENGRGVRILDALELGATWTEVADALDTTTGHARALLRIHADGQRALYRSDLGRDLHHLGFGPEAYAGVIALIDLADDEPAAAKTGAGKD